MLGLAGRTDSSRNRVAPRRGARVECGTFILGAGNGRGTAWGRQQSCVDRGDGDAREAFAFDFMHERGQFVATDLWETFQGYERAADMLSVSEWSNNGENGIPTGSIVARKLLHMAGEARDKKSGVILGLQSAGQVNLSVARSLFNMHPICGSLLPRSISVSKDGSRDYGCAVAEPARRGAQSAALPSAVETWNRKPRCEARTFRAALQDRCCATTRSHCIDDFVDFIAIGDATCISTQIPFAQESSKMSSTLRIEWDATPSEDVQTSDHVADFQEQRLFPDDCGSDLPACTWRIRVQAPGHEDEEVLEF